MNKPHLGENSGPMDFLISVVVPCRNERDFIGILLDNILAQEGLPGPVEVIISDGMSTDGTRDIIQSYVEGKSHFYLMDNCQQITPVGLNLAIGAARGKYIARMDVHSEYAPDYLAKCLEVSLATKAANVGGAARTKAQGRKAKAIAAAYGSPFAVGNASFHFPDFEGPVDSVPYGFWEKDFLLEIGLFDDSLVRNQDDELNFRITQSGGKIWQSAKIVSWYKPRNSFRTLFKQYFQYGFWKTVVIQKHGALASWRHLVPAIFVLGLMVELIGGLFWPPLASLFLIQIALYAMFLFIGSVIISKANGWDLFFLIPFAIGVFHFGYGLGFLSGLLNRFRGGQKGPISLSR